MPEPHQLRKIATLTGVSYRAVLEAALVDAGYLRREGLDEPDDRPVGRVTVADTVTGDVTGARVTAHRRKG